MDWIGKVRDGDFAAIPATVDFASACDLADLIDGYDLVGDEQRASEIYLGVIQQCRRPGAVQASPLDLWIALFYAHDAYRQAGSLPTGDEAVPYDRLARELRAALLRLSAAQKAGIMTSSGARRPCRSRFVAFRSESYAIRARLAIFAIVAREQPVRLGSPSTTPRPGAWRQCPRCASYWWAAPCIGFGRRQSLDLGAEKCSRLHVLRTASKSKRRGWRSRRGAAVDRHRALYNPPAMSSARLSFLLAPGAGAPSSHPECRTSPGCSFHWAPSQRSIIPSCSLGANGLNHFHD